MKKIPKVIDKISRTYHLSPRVIAKLEKKTMELTETKHGLSVVLGKMIDFACDNAGDFEDYFVFDPKKENK